MVFLLSGVSVDKIVRLQTTFLVISSTCLAQVRFSSLQTPKYLVCLTHFKEMPFTDKFRSLSNVSFLCLDPIIIHSDFSMFSDNLFAICHIDTLDR